MTDFNESDHTRLVLLEKQIAELRRDVKTQTTATRDLLDAWNSAKWLVGLVRLIGSVAVALGACYALFKGIYTLGKGG